MRRVILFFTAALILSGCATVGEPTGTSSHGLAANVDVTFNALLPVNHPVDDGVMFTILDEVTGLDFNPQRTEMQTSGENSASITLSVPAGTMLKYRYTRTGESGNIDELGANGEFIAYREYLVDGPGHVAYDMVAAWADLPSPVETGQITGIITEAGTDNPLADIVVIAAGQQARTDNDGHYLILSLPQGLHNVIVSSPSGSHLPFQQGALVAANSETPANIALTPNLMANVTFTFIPPAEHTPSTPIFIAGNLSTFDPQPLMSAQADGRYSLTMELPTGIDIRYKYTLGDGFWNAEHKANGNFQLRQLFIPAGTTDLQINDQGESWSAGSTAPIWFDLTAPDNGALVYLQFKLIDWTTPLPMWPLGGGEWAYKLYSPTNFAAALEYRYCLDSSCTILESAPGQPRSVAGNKDEQQNIEDSVEAWQEQ